MRAARRRIAAAPTTPRGVIPSEGLRRLQTAAEESWQDLLTSRNPCAGRTTSIKTMS